MNRIEEKMSRDRSRQERWIIIRVDGKADGETNRARWWELLEDQPRMVGRWDG